LFLKKSNIFIVSRFREQSIFYQISIANIAVDFLYPKIQNPKGAMPMQKQITTATTQSPTITKKIGQSVYTIQIDFSKTSKENFNDKVMRIVKNDIARSAAAS